MNFFKIFNLKVEKPSENDKDYSNKILFWGLQLNQNDYAIKVLKAISESPTASACMSTKTDYIRGGGFNIQSIDKLKVNKDEKLNALHNGLSETVNKLKGIAIHVKRDVEGNIVGLTKVPFEDCRLGIPDENDEVNKIVYNPRWEQREFKFSESTYYDLFTTDVNLYKERLLQHQQEQAQKEPDKRKKYPGEIYWDCLKKDGYPFYPYAFSEFDIKAFETDSQFTNYDYNNIYNNFFLGGVFNVYGDPNEKIYEPYERTGKLGETIIDERFVGTRGEIFNREMQDNFGGGENTGKWMVNWMQTEGQKLDVAAFPVNTNSDLFQTTQGRIWNKISHITKVPNILANIETAGKLGNSQEILNAIQLINNSVTIQQSLLEDAYNTLLPLHIKFRGLINEEIKIKKLNPVSFIPDKVWDSIPNEAKLNYVKNNYDIDIETEEGDSVDEAKIVSRFAEFGVGGVTGILQIQQAVADGITAYDSALATLQIIYGFKDANARRILGENKQVNTLPDGSEVPKQQTNDAITNLTGRQMQNIQRIVRKFNKGDLTYDQASVMLKNGFGFNEEEIKLWLDGIEDNENVNVTP